MKKSLKQLTVITSAILLIACGGSDNGDDGNSNNPTNAIPLNSGNARDIAVNTYTLASLTIAARGLINTTFEIDDAQNGSNSNNGEAPSVPQPDPASFVSRGADLLLSKTSEEDAPACPGGGTETITIVDTAPEDDFNDGDSATITYANCIQDNNDPITVNGSASMLINSIDDNNANIAFSFNSLSAASNGDTLVFNGSLIIDHSNDSSTETETTRITSSSFTITYNNNVFTFSDYSYINTFGNNGETEDLDYIFTSPAGSVTVTTNPILTNTDDSECPTFGVVTITGANSSIVLDANTGDQNTFLMTVNDGVATTTESIDCDDLLAPFDQEASSSSSSTTTPDESAPD